MEEQFGTEQDLMDSIQQGLAQDFGQDFAADENAMKKAKTESLREMTKALPEWSLEPPETFLS